MNILPSTSARVLLAMAAATVSSRAVNMSDVFTGTDGSNNSPVSLPGELNSVPQFSNQDGGNVSFGSIFLGGGGGGGAGSSLGGGGGGSGSGGGGGGALTAGGNGGGPNLGGGSSGGGGAAGGGLGMIGGGEQGGVIGGDGGDFGFEPLGVNLFLGGNGGGGSVSGFTSGGGTLSSSSQINLLEMPFDAGSWNGSGGQASGGNGGNAIFVFGNGTQVTALDNVYLGGGGGGGGGAQAGGGKNGGDGGYGRMGLSGGSLTVNGTTYLGGNGGSYGGVHVSGAGGAGGNGGYGMLLLRQGSTVNSAGGIVIGGVNGDLSGTWSTENLRGQGGGGYLVIAEGSSVTTQGQVVINPQGILYFSHEELGYGAGGSISAAGGIVNNGAIGGFNSDTVTISSNISGTGRVVQQGPGTLVLAGTNTFSQDLSIFAGKVQIGNGGTSGSVTAPIWLSGSGAGIAPQLVFNRSDTWTLTAKIQGSQGNVVQAGTGTTILTADNIINGTVYVNSGTLQLGSGFNGGTVGSAGIQVQSGARLAINRNNNMTLSNSVIGQGTIVKEGTNALTLGNIATFAGNIEVNAGTLNASNSTALGATTGGTVTVGNGGTLMVLNNVNFGTKAFSLSGQGTGGAGALRSFSGNQVIGGQVRVAGNARIQVDADALHLSGGVANQSTTAGFEKTGNGTLILSGASTYTGSTNISSGTVLFSNASSLYNGVTSQWNSSSVIVSNGAAAAFRVGGAGEFTAAHIPDLLKLGFQTGSSFALNTSNAVNGVFEYGGNLSNPSSVALNLRKDGAGTLALTGNSNYTGTTYVAEGTLQIGNGGTTGTLSSGAVQINGNNDAALRFNRSDNITINNAFSGAGRIVQGGTGELTLTNAGAFEGSIEVESGTLVVNSSTALPTAPSLLVVSNGTLALGNHTTLGSMLMVLANLDGLTNDHLRSVTGSNTLQTDVYLSGAIKVRAEAGSSLTASGALSNFFAAGGLEKTGAGKLILTGANSYSGATKVTEGTLLVNGNSSGLTGAATVAAGGTFGGTGRFGGSLNVTGTLAPGASIESLATGSVTLNAGATFAYEINSSSLNGDLLVVQGDLAIDNLSLLSIVELSSGTRSLGDKLTLINYSGVWNGGTWSGYADDSTFQLGSNIWKINYDDQLKGGNFNAEQLGLNSVTITVVPEVSITMLGGLGALALLRRRRN